ncbi:BACON domain-containing protein [Acanthopleuribacter pedis]|uniref:BACON domain-containing protein n=1 Tax=Acanthopleuribacter pedis TaxID=442870 RepID=A0A8J7Q788_9BACT|nr:BACON domain-containing carbohydrate-binding protein [Acanthopleuribacter pedis]MBO1319591.1 hypothetical protein [Acanthopleuribacter pedis]
MKNARIALGLVFVGLISFSGFWLKPPPASSTSTGEPMRADAFLKDKGKNPYDQPAEAAAFFQRKRMPAGDNQLTYHQRLSAGQAESDALPLFSSRFDTYLDPEEATRFGGAASWSQLGPGNIGGRTRAMVINPTNPDLMVAGGVSGGTWRTTDGGANWTATGDMLANLAVTSMAMDPNDSDTILAGTGEGFFNIDAVRGAGIFKSTDGGLTWAYLANTATSDFYYVNDIVYSTTVANVAYAATRTGIFRTTNGGTNWTQIYTAGVTGGCLDLAIRSDQATDVLFASVGTFTQATIYRNSDAANTTTFTSVYTETDMGRTSIAIAPSNQDVVYLLASNRNGGGISGFTYGLLAVIRSTDGGTSWSDRHRSVSPIDGADLLLSNPLSFLCSASILSQGWYDNIIAVDPLDEDIVWAGGIDTFRSDDGGASWGMASHWAVNDTASMYVHADQHGFFFHPDYNGTTNQTLYITNDGGVFRTDNARAAVATIGTSAACSASGTFSVVFTNLNNSYGVTQFYHGLPYPSGDTYFGGTQDNGTLRGDDTSGLNSWVELFGGDGGYVAINPNDTNILYVETTGISIRKSTNGGSSFSSAVSGISDSGQFINPFVMDPNDPDRLWTSGGELWRTDDAAGSWTQASNDTTGLPSTGSAIAVAPGNSDLVLAGTDNGYIRRTTSATTATSSTTWTETRPNSGYVSSVAFDPQDADIAYCTYSTFGVDHVYRSTDGGASWTSIDNNLPDIPVHSIAVHPTDSTRLYLGTDLGVYVSTNTGTSWAQENTGYANVVTEWLAFQQTDCQLNLFAFTHGRGAWRLPIDGLSLSSSSLQVAAAGTSSSVSVTADGACSWTAVASDSWITVTSGASGTGNGTVQFTVAENTAASTRSGTITMGSEVFTISQDAACTYSLSASSNSFDNAGGTGSFNVTTNVQTCTWTAVASESWVTITAGSSGTGDGSVSYSVAANTGSETRNATITVGDQTYSISQTGVTCTYALSASSNAFDSAGGTGSFNLTTNVQTCTWTAVSSESWVTITAGSSGTGDGSVSYSVAANTGTETRNATITAGGETYSISQTGVACTYTLSAGSNSFDDTGGTGSFNVTTNVQTCTWTAVASESWVTVTAGSSGTGDGSVSYSVAANTTTSSRSATLTVGDQTYSISQSGVNCSYSLSASSNSFDDAGGNGSFNVTTNVQTCSWSATTQFKWITLTSATSGTGDGTISYTVAANTSTDSRTGTIQVQDQVYTIQQSGAPCAFTLSASSASFTTDGGTDSFNVQANGASCSWTATTQDDWITITAGSSGTGDGTVSFSVAANTGTSARNGVISAGAQTFTVNQSGLSCSYSLSSGSAAYDDTGGGGSFNVTTNGQTCTWTATTGDPWITITAGSSGTGDGTVSYTVAANTTTASRSGTIQVGDQTFSVSQSGVTCAFTLSASSAAYEEAGGSGSFTITANVQTCTWSATTKDNWITITAGTSGTGDGTVAYTVSANTTTSQRSGTIIAGGQTYSISQAAGTCQFSLSSSSGSFDGQGGSGSFNLSANIQSCTWSASAADSWVTITSGASGTGDGSIAFTVAANTTTATRSTSITAGGLIFSIQQSGLDCTYSLSSSSLSLDDQGGNGSVNVSTNVQTCSWTASTQDAWITITSGLSGTGDGTVAFTVAVNTGATRSGTIQIADQTFTVNQTGAACSYTLSASSASFADTGGTGSFNITTNLQDCAWSAVTQDPWISITGGAAGTGNGSVSFSVSPNPGGARSGVIVAGGQTFAVTQAAFTCSFALSTTGTSIGAGGGSGGFDITTNGAECSWTAVSQDPWITITAGASGSGNGSVVFSAAANPGTSARTGTILAGGQTFTLQQGGASCTYSLPIGAAGFSDAGGSGSFFIFPSVDTCTWTASTQFDWITITAGSSGTGNGEIAFTVAANNSLEARSGTILAADQTFSIQQAATTCAITLATRSADFTVDGGTGTIEVGTNLDICTWQTTTQFDWITITQGQSGTGDGTVGYTVAENTSTQARIGNIQVGNQFFTVNQDGVVPCAYTLTPASATAPADGTTAGFEVQTNKVDCAWTATTQDSWITISSGQSGTGNGGVTYAVAENTDIASRTGAISVADQTFTIVQAGRTPCDLTLSATSAGFFEDGGNGGFEIQTNLTTCAWTATTQDDWITITAGQTGVGAGSVTFAVAVLDGTTARTGTITVTNADETLTFTISQQRCTQSPAFFAALPNWNASVTVLDLVPLAGCTEASAKTKSQPKTSLPPTTAATEPSDR